jgi:hypothetical protein
VPQLWRRQRGRSRANGLRLPGIGPAGPAQADRRSIRYRSTSGRVSMALFRLTTSSAAWARSGSEAQSAEDASSVTRALVIANGSNLSLGVRPRIFFYIAAPSSAVQLRQTGGSENEPPAGRSQDGSVSFRWKDYRIEVPGAEKPWRSRPTILSAGS